MAKNLLKAFRSTTDITGDPDIMEASFCRRSGRRGIVELCQVSARLREGVSGVLVFYARFAFEKAA